MANLVYATSRDLQAIAPDYLTHLWGSDPLFEKLVPMEFEDVASLVWEQEDNSTGLMGARVLDGGFNKVDRLGRSEYTVTPGYFGDQAVISEKFLTVGRQIGTYGQPIDLRAEQQKDMVRLMGRGYDLIRYIVWTLVGTGTYNIPFVNGFNGIKALADSFPFQTYAAATGWSNLATATPIADLMAMQLLARGHSVRFDSSSVFVINQKTANYLFNNTNANDIGNRRVYGIDGPSLDIEGVNKITMLKNLPQIAIYDEGYYPSQASSWTPFVPDSTGILWGNRKDAGKNVEWVFTHNPNNLVGDRQVDRTGLNRSLSAAQVYVNAKVKEDPIQGFTTVGLNGAPRAFFPSAIVRATL